MAHINLVAPCGSAEPGALIIVINTNTNIPPTEDQVRGTFADVTCGSWKVMNVYAQNGDVLDITQQFGSEASQVLTVQVQVP
jgi:hypothetical protein